MAINAFDVLFDNDVTPTEAKPSAGTKRGRPVSRTPVPKIPVWVLSKSAFDAEVIAMALKRGTTIANAYHALTAAKMEILAVRWYCPHPYDAKPKILTDNLYCPRPDDARIITDHAVYRLWCTSDVAVHDAESGLYGVRVDDFYSEILSVSLKGVVISTRYNRDFEDVRDYFDWGCRVAVQVGATDTHGDRIWIKLILHETGRILKWWKVSKYLCDEPKEWISGVFGPAHPADAIFINGINSSVERHIRESKKPWRDPLLDGAYR